MSLLDDNLDIGVKDVIEASCKVFVKRYILNYDTDTFIFTWGAIKPNSIMKYPRKYYLGIMNIDNICFMTVFNKYHQYDPYCCYSIIKNTTIYDILNFN